MSIDTLIDNGDIRYVLVSATWCQPCDLLKEKLGLPMSPNPSMYIHDSVLVITIDDDLSLIPEQIQENLEAYPSVFCIHQTNVEEIDPKNTDFLCNIIVGHLKDFIRTENSTHYKNKPWKKWILDMVYRNIHTSNDWKNTPLGTDLSALTADRQTAFNNIVSLISSIISNNVQCKYIIKRSYETLITPNKL